MIFLLTSSLSSQNYTQNIDTLETRAGVRKVLQCHGSFATASCINCHRRVPGNALEDDIMSHRVALCTICNAPGQTSLPANKGKKKAGKKKKNAALQQEFAAQSSQALHLGHHGDRCQFAEPPSIFTIVHTNGIHNT